MAVSLSFSVLIEMQIGCLLFEPMVSKQTKCRLCQFSKISVRKNPTNLDLIIYGIGNRKVHFYRKRKGIQRPLKAESRIGWFTMAGICPNGCCLCISAHLVNIWRGELWQRIQQCWIVMRTFSQKSECCTQVQKLF